MTEVSTYTPDHTNIPSPFLPETKIQYAWDSSSLGYLKTCGKLYEYIMIEGWSPKGESVHLEFGREYHSALENYDRYKYVDGLSHEEALRETVLQTLQRTVDFLPDQTTKAGKYKNRHTLIRLIIDYLDKYTVDPAETMILDNGQPAVELSFRFELDWGPKAAPQPPMYVAVGDDISDDYMKPGAIAYAKDIVPVPAIGPSQPYLLSGHLDRVVSFNGELFVMDRKTTTTTPGSYFFDQFAPNNQMTLYTLASQVILEAPIKGVIIDAAQILVHSSSFVRGFTYRTKDQIDEWVDDLGYWFAVAETYAENDHWPMNDTACDKFGGCRFRGICSKSPQVRETFLKGEFDKLAPEDRWNPLKAR